MQGLRSSNDSEELHLNVVQLAVNDDVLMKLCEEAAALC